MRPAIGLDQPEAELERGGLARAVRAEQAEAFSRRHCEVDAGDDFKRAVRLAQPARRAARSTPVGLTTRASTCSLRWKKWPAPGTTTTGSACGRAQSSTSRRGTVVVSRRGSPACRRGTGGAMKRVTPTPTSTSHSGSGAARAGPAAKRRTKTRPGHERPVLHLSGRTPSPRARRALVVHALGRADAAEIGPPRLRSPARGRRAPGSARPCCRACRRNRGCGCAISATPRRRLAGVDRPRIRSARRGRPELATRLAPHYIRSRSTTRPFCRCSSMISSMSARST